MEMEKVWVLVFLYVSCTAALDRVQKRDFIPSASMDTEGGWRVLKGSILSNEELDDNIPVIYQSPKSEKLSSSAVEPDFLNNDEEFRINVENITPDNLLNTDSLPVASSYLTATSNQVTPSLSFVSPSYGFYDSSQFLKPPAFDNLEKYSFYMPPEIPFSKFLYEPDPSHYLFRDKFPQETALRSYQQPPQSMNEFFEPFSEYATFPQMLPFRKAPKVEDQVQYYEFNNSLPPLILSEEIAMFGVKRPISSHLPPIPHKTNFFRGNINPRPSIFGPPPPPHLVVGAKRIASKPNYSKRAIKPFGSGFSKNVPIMRGRFML
ncbi:uncharacterized protein LOC129723401 [Wyeomyia smithii]|uniref:uncharacterized protein LOC129723401 n=1 Tax=Wyeomyia smithii TaxID=174621 RepID=UPI002467BC55|nr:uncharacterized protein LOC129723401 [Wyeomyia smithii]